MEATDKVNTNVNVKETCDKAIAFIKNYDPKHPYHGLPTFLEDSIEKSVLDSIRANQVFIVCYFDVKKGSKVIIERDDNPYLTTFNGKVVSYNDERRCLRKLVIAVCDRNIADKVYFDFVGGMDYSSGQTKDTRITSLNEENVEVIGNLVSLLKDLLKTINSELPHLESYDA